LAILLDSGRVTVGANQALINDAEKGDKGFTPEVFEKQLVEKFKERSGVDLTNLKSANVPEMAKKLLPQLVEVSKQTVAENQSIIIKRGSALRASYRRPSAPMRPPSSAPRQEFTSSRPRTTGCCGTPPTRPTSSKQACCKSLPIRRTPARARKLSARQRMAGKSSG